MQPSRTVTVSKIDVNYSNFTTRHNSFTNWNKEQSIDSLAGAGFYYEGPDDSVRCFHCGVRLSKWKKSDIPWEEHRRHSPGCKFIKENMHYSFYHPSDAIMPHGEDILIVHPDEETRNECLVEAGRCGLTQILSNQNAAGYLRSPAARAVIETSKDREQTEKYVLEALEILCIGQHRPSAEQIHCLVSKFKKKETRIKQLESKIEKITKEKEYKESCSICAAGQRKIVFVPCGHFLCCESCSCKLQQHNHHTCPTCRQKVDSRVKVHIS